MTADPHLWLEDVLGKDQLAWVERCNAQCLSDIGDPKVTPCFTRILDVLDSKVRRSVGIRCVCVCVCRLITGSYIYIYK